jgi:nucleoside-diphosphate-sugar epimerase
MRVLVTGGAGFIGSNLVRYALGMDDASCTAVELVDRLVADADAVGEDASS